MSGLRERNPSGIGCGRFALYLAAVIGIVMFGFLLLLAVGPHAEFLQSSGLVPSGSDNWFSGLDTAVKNADGEMTLAAIATSPVAAAVIGVTHYSGSQQSHKHAGRVLGGLVILLAIAPHIAS